MKWILLQGGRVIDPSRGFDRIADVSLWGGTIAAIETGVAHIGADTVVIDCRGWWVTPGLIDPHVHLRDPGFPEKETIFSGLRAAAAGGFTTVAAMANTSPVNDTPEITRYMIERANAAHAVRLVPVSAVTRGLEGRELVDIEAMAAAGARLFSDDGLPIDDAAVLGRALPAVAARGRVISLHEEDRALTAGGAMNAGATAERLGVKGIPGRAESDRVRRDLAIAREVGAPVHLAHVSTAASLDLVREARAAGVDVTCEAAPHHFTLDDGAVLQSGPDARMAPPLRDRADRDAVRAGIADGTIDMIATDHAPHDPASKNMDCLGSLFPRSDRAAKLPAAAVRAMCSAANGIVGLETALGLTLALVHQGLITPARMVELMAVKPARLLRLEGAGTLSAGLAADLTVIDPDRAWRVDPTRFASLSRNTPYTGMELRGKAMLTIVGGVIVHDGRSGESR